MKTSKITIKYSKELDKLKKMLEKSGIECRMHYDFDIGMTRLRVYLSGDRYLSAISGKYALGDEKGLLEISGGLTDEEWVECGGRKGDRFSATMGWLTAQEVFERFKYCKEHNTLRYVA